MQKTKKLSFWGAGGFSVAAILYGIKERYISYIVDNDTKENMEFLQ